MKSPHTFNQTIDLWRENLSEGHFQRKIFLKNDKRAQKTRENGQIQGVLMVFSQKLSIVNTMEEFLLVKSKKNGKGKIH